MFLQKILFGSPGTGKSYKIHHEIIPKELDIENKDNIISTVFHPEYTYGDFIGKLTPISLSGKVEYNFYEGDFLKALSLAYKNLMEASGNIETAQKVVLVIDEINRGNSSAIFGSIFQLLDRDDDGWSSYKINVNGVVFAKILELIGFMYNDDRYFPISQKGDKVLARSNQTATEFQQFIGFTGFDIINKTIKIPPNLSILATMNTSDSSIYYMDSAFKRRFDWEFIDINSESTNATGTAFKDEKEWQTFIDKLNNFIKSNHKFIRGIEDKQIGQYFIKCKDKQISKSSVQNKLMFFLWDNVFSRDKKPLEELLFGKTDEQKLITFGDFANQIDAFIKKIDKYKS